MSQPPNHLSSRSCREATTQLPNLLSIFLLLTLFALLVFSIQTKSPTLDEQNHIARGLAYLKTGDLRLSQEHPPLINAWQAWPLLLDPGIKLPLDNPSWANAEWYGFADLMLWRANDGATRERMVFAARVCTMGLTLLLAALVYRWAKALGGPWAGLLAMAMLVFDPNILAHGRLVTTDMGVTCLSVAAMYALWNALRQDADRVCGVTLGWRWVAAGAVFGLALVSKFSALVLGPVLLTVVLLAYLGRCLKNKAMLNAWPWIARLALLYGAGLGAIWAVYGFEWGAIDLLGGLPGPAPSYFAGIQSILQRTSGGSTAFLMGQYSQTGWWYYFPVAFAIKTPLPALVLLIAAVILAIKAQRAKSKSVSFPLIPYSLFLIPVLAFWSMALFSGFNIGYRHILPSLPFIYIFMGWQLKQVVNIKPSIRRLLAVGGCLLLAWLVIDVFFIFPHYLAFFNFLAGGPDGGYRFLVDSNLDWGQDLPSLAKWVKKNNIEHINLSWFGAANPEAYGLNFHPLPGFWRFSSNPTAYGFNPYNPAPGAYAISASNLQGLKLADRDTFAWFRQRKPDYDIGHSILIYRVEEQSSLNQAVVLGVPMVQLGDEEQALLKNSASVRQFDPATGLIIPVAESAWFVMPEAPAWGQATRQEPGYVVVQGTPPLHASTMYSSPLSVQFGKWVRIQYHRVESLIAGKPLIVQVEWAVSAPPHRAATSFAHLLDAEGRYVAGWDGLTAPATCWQPGDVIVQNYVIPLSADLKPGTYQIEVGWYDAETLQRWPCAVDGNPVGDRWLIPDVAIGE